MTHGIWVCFLLNGAAIVVLFGAVVTVWSQRRKDLRNQRGFTRSRDRS